MTAARDLQDTFPEGKDGDSQNGMLSLIPIEVLERTFDAMLEENDGVATVAKLSRTCKMFYALAMPKLHKCVAVAAETSPDRLIRTLSRYFSDEQIKKLEEVNKDVATELRLLPSPNNGHAKEHVRHLRIGNIKQFGHKNANIFFPYIEEAFKSLQELEIVDTAILSESIARSMASMKKLKALRLVNDSITAENKALLSNLQHLQHLSIIPAYNADIFSASDSRNTHVRDILQGLAPTIRVLEVISNSCCSDFVPGWNKAATSHSASQVRLDSLKSFTLQKISFDEAFVSSLHAAIVFPALHRLVLGPIYGGRDLFFNSLIRVFANGGDRLQLRILRMSICPNTPAEESYAPFRSESAICRFLSSFDTLSTLELKLEIHLHDAADGGDVPDPGLPDALLQALLKHKGLETLVISPTTYSNHPWLSPSAVAKIIDAMPLLHGFEFVPGEDIEGIGRELSRAPKLEYIICRPTHDPLVEPDEATIKEMLQTLLRSFLSADINTESPNEGFVWEDHYRLRRIAVCDTVWQIASRLSWRNDAREVKVTDNKDKERVAYYRDISIPWVPVFKWDWNKPSTIWMKNVERGYAEDDSWMDPGLAWLV